MHILKYSVTLSLLLLCVGLVRSQESRSEFRLDFRVNSTSVDSLYGDNTVNMRDLIDFLRKVRSDSTIHVTKVLFRGAASPEGSRALNRRLAGGRLSVLESIVRSEIELPDSIISRDDSYIPWESLKSLVKESDISHKEEVIAILDMKPEYVEYRSGAKIDRRVLELQKLDSGSVWQQMKDMFFSRLRNACAVFVSYVKAVPPVPPVTAVTDTVAAEEPLPVDVIVTDNVVVTDSLTKNAAAETLPAVPEEWRWHMYVKTNAIGWAMGVANIAAEVDIVEHWSFSLPIYWSSWNYFKRTLKFRTFTLQPEVRYWLSDSCNGWFAGAHFGLGWYNIATCGDYRTQDHNGDSPAIGGGVSVGYRLPLCGNGRWRMEFSLGAGAYRVHYDKFHNEPNGLLVDTEKKTWFGIDRASVSMVYMFGTDKKKGGAR